MRTIDYKSYDGKTYEVSVREDKEYWYIDFNTGLSEGIYPKIDWSLDKTIENQNHIFDENY